MDLLSETMLSVFWNLWKIFLPSKLSYDIKKIKLQVSFANVGIIVIKVVLYLCVFQRSKKPICIWKERTCSERQWRTSRSCSLWREILQWGLLKVFPWKFTLRKKEKTEIKWPRQISICDNEPCIKSGKCRRIYMPKIFWESQGYISWGSQQ